MYSKHKAKNDELIQTSEVNEQLFGATSVGADLEDEPNHHHNKSRKKKKGKKVVKKKKKVSKKWNEVIEETHPQENGDIFTDEEAMALKMKSLMDLS